MLANNTPTRITTITNAMGRFLLLLLLTACAAPGNQPAGQQQQQAGETSATPTTPATSLPSPTLRPSPSPLPPTNTPIPSPTPADRPTLLPPTPTRRPTMTPLPPTPAPTTSPGSVLQSGETWHTDGWALTVSDFTYHSFHEIHFTLHNLTGRTVLFPEFSTSTFRIVSDAGDTFAPCSIKGSGWYNTTWRTIGQTSIEANDTMEWQWKFYTYDPEHRACDSYTRNVPVFSSDAHTLTLTVENLGDVMVDAQWMAKIPRP